MLTLMMALVACSSPVDDLPYEEEVTQDFATWESGLNYVADGLTADDYMFFTEEYDVVYIYVDYAVWQRIQYQLHGLQGLGYGLETNYDWDLGSVSIIRFHPDAAPEFAKIDLGTVHDNKDMRLSLAALDLVNCAPDENGDGLGDGKTCWADLELLRLEIDTRRYTCHGDDSVGNSDITNIGVSLVGGVVVPRNDNCGLTFTE